MTGTDPEELAAVDKPRGEVPLPVSWYLGAHGDPVARFDHIVLTLHHDGTVTWRDAREEA